MAQAPATRPFDEGLAEGPPAVGAKLQVLRQARKLSLDELSRRAGVSKSMLSQVERNLANPTVAVLWRLATALGVGLADFLSPEAAADAAPTVTVIPAHSIPVIKSPDGKCELKILGPVDLAARFEWYELSIQPGGVLASEPHEVGTKEHLSVLSGTLTVQSGASEKKVRHGESARYPADVQHAISNAGKTVATALLVVECAQ
ncbi:helix-turn-helix domain-containing protein [Ralstonia insidiosa]|uniref:Helix-turn-helix domain-containing protein n=1 Tax=Ralstonia insidiosa TaxID=190721 RepID=A0A848P727_9RALS|nr:XRE family transcriptional regulator [Ralstonia insidiosa]NMV41379.1 helix-turn-helix domain-containing protein [Ralstonia insidiosa]